MVFTINSNIIENLSNVKMDVVDNSTRFAIIENNNTGGIITNIENETKNVNEKIEYFNKYGFIKIRINRNKLNQFIDKILGDLSLENRQKIKNRTNADKLIPLIHNNSQSNIYLINKNNLDEIIIPKVLISNDIENYLKLTTLDIPTGKIGEFEIKIRNLLKNSDTTTLILICDIILKSFVSFFTNIDSQSLNHNISNFKFLEIAGDQLITLLSKNNCLKVKEDSFIEYDNELCNIPKTESNCPVCPDLCPTCPVCPELYPTEDKPNYLWQILSVIFIIIIFLLVIMLMSNKSRVNNLIRTINRLRYEYQ
jgi:hypothetical protein